MLPQRKVAAGGLGGAVAVIVCAVLQGLRVAVDATLAVSITVVVTFLISYLVPEADLTTPVPLNGDSK